MVGLCELSDHAVILRWLSDICSGEFADNIERIGDLSAQDVEGVRKSASDAVALWPYNCLLRRQQNAGDRDVEAAISKTLPSTNGAEPLGCSHQPQ